MTIGFLPGRRSAGLVVGVIDHQSGVDVNVQPTLGGGGSGPPGRRPRPGPRCPHPRQVGGIDALIDQPPHGGRRRLRAEHMLTIAAQLTNCVDAVRSVGDRGRQIGEHVPGRIHPRAVVGVGQRGGDLRRQPSAVRELAQHAHPGMRHDTMTVGGHFHPRCQRHILHSRSAFP